MKKMFLAITALLVASCASSPPKPGAAEQWVNLMKSNNQVSAAINTMNGDVKFYESAEDSFKVLFGAFTKYSKECVPAPKPAVTAEPKKKEKKK